MMWKDQICYVKITGRDQRYHSSAVKVNGKVSVCRCVCMFWAPLQFNNDTVFSTNARDNKNRFKHSWNNLLLERSPVNSFWPVCFHLCMLLQWLPGDEGPWGKTNDPAVLRISISINKGLLVWKKWSKKWILL